jgi:hypothetical protein
MRKTGILGQDHERVNRQRLAAQLKLTDDEVLRLMQAATVGKTILDDSDLVTICDWALTQKVSSVIWRLVMAGHMNVSVDDGEVQVALVAGAQCPRCVP